MAACLGRTALMTLVSCIMPTRDRRSFVPKAIEHFLRQDYADRELIIVDDGADSVAGLAPASERIRYIRLPARSSIGAKRNLACREARGDIILHWDDDDWYAPWRVSYQVEQLDQSGVDICGLDRLYYYDPANRRAWEYRYTNQERPWVAGNTLCYRKQFWQKHPFPEIDIGEDSRFVWQAKPERVLRLENNRFIVAYIHGSNVSPKATGGTYWQQSAVEPVLALMAPERRQAALVTASLGIGDILRVTPLVRVLHQSGFAVDVLIEPDYPDTAALLEPAPEIRRVYCSPRNGTGEMPQTHYEVATFTYWSRGLQPRIDARRKMAFESSSWLREGDTRAVERIARDLGWTGSLPAPIAVASNRCFDLPRGTLAIHTGCKPDWPWKKWHGFDELAERFEHVALIGTPRDSDNANTYFHRDFHWPAHVRNYSGKLTLSDTAALISQCGALVANDSGIMQLSAALGVPTFGIFGITSPQRESMALPNMIPVTKGLACEPACRQQAWGRRDCEHHLQCLETLSAGEVASRIQASVSSIPARAFGPRPQDRKMTKLGLVYHGHVFDASGYGSAARAYIHALHAAGVDLSVEDLSGHPRQVSDPLVESLAGRPVQADFHLFHGIPHVWAHQAFRLPNAIAITVWETDTMPTQWRNTLEHPLETWLPCDFNVDAFRPHLRRPLAKIPHPLLPRNGHSNGSRPALFDLKPDTFAAYSIFEWQERKCPFEQLVCFLRAFSSRDSAALIVKTNPGAASAARAALDAARRETGSDAQVILCAESWSEEQIGRLHNRGDCYLSLHRGEGWCYPLFEAASAGTPVVATAYAGPLEYLDAGYHQLVRCALAPVRQPYMYYHPRMKWAQPDLDDAVSRLRWVYEHREQAGAAAREAALRIRRRFSLEVVGHLAKTRLLNLLERTNRSRWVELRSAEPREAPPANGPIPAEWFDADYFENGLKSNWTSGYHWQHFGGLFSDTAAFLASMFPGATRYFDAGAAKGFLIRALREAGVEAWGCDLSPWAVDSAEAAAKPYLECAPAECFHWEQDYDVLVAFHLLPQLTEQQVTMFLERARPHVRIAFVAVISLFESQETSAPDADQAHVTRRNRAWWHERILAAGWRQDPLHRAMQQVCQRQLLPTRMGWEMFVYSPGT
jgi:ADP-heptose:LPS heptosyltransferase/glycosyltransferase involved in cell wall biosynthesis